MRNVNIKKHGKFNYNCIATVGDKLKYSAV
jgi:hypothetical protein